jgi:molecular chaperone GrpE
MNKSKKNGKDIPVEYLEENQNKDFQEFTAEPEEERKNSTKVKSKTDKFKKLYDEAQEKYKVLNEQFLRFRAEFSNYKKRVEREQIEYSGYLKGELIKKILPILDDFNHMLEKSQENVNGELVLDGANLIYDKLFQILTNEGLEKIEASGEEFDPQIHEAMMIQKTSDENENNKVINVFQEGYRIGEKLLRPSKVIVGNYEEES